MERAAAARTDAFINIDRYIFAWQMLGKPLPA
jgi:hypothetical protein